LREGDGKIIEDREDGEDGEDGEVVAATIFYLSIYLRPLRRLRLLFSHGSPYL